MVPLPQNLSGGLSRTEATVYLSPHLPDVPVDYPNVGGTATTYVSGVSASKVSWMLGSSPGMTE
jgi:hypothetical protein